MNARILRGIVGSVILLTFSFVCFFSSTMIKPGYVGIKVNAYGSQKGVADYPVYTGRIWYNPLTTSVFDYPTFTQNAVWQGVEKISFNTSEGSRVSCDVGLAYMLNPDKVPHIFVKHRQELPYITHNYLRNKVRDALNQHSSEYTAINVLGPKSQELLLKAKKELMDTLEEEGFIIDTLSFISAPEPENNNVKESITQVIASTQRAIEAENKVKQIEAEARQEVAKAEGKALAILAEAKAQSEANKILAESITPTLVYYKLVETWDGKAPQVIGSESLILQLDKK